MIEYAAMHPNGRVIGISYTVRAEAEDHALQLRRKVYGMETELTVVQREVSAWTPVQ